MWRGPKEIAIARLRASNSNDLQNNVKNDVSSTKLGRSNLWLKAEAARLRAEAEALEVSCSNPSMTALL